MNKVIIVDASESDRRLMSSLLVKHGYKPIAYIVRFRVNSIASLPVTPSIVISMTVTTLRNLLISTVGSIPSLYFSESFCYFNQKCNRSLGFGIDRNIFCDSLFPPNHILPTCFTSVGIPVCEEQGSQPCSS